MNFRIAFVLMILLISSAVISQEIRISKEINVRSDLAYDILPNIGGNILFYRDKGDSYFLDIFDADLQFKRTTEIFFDIKKVDVNYIIPRDTSLSIVYTYRKSGENHVKINTYDASATLIDTAVIFSSTDNLPYGGLKSVVSEDNSKILLFGYIKKQMLMMIFDFKTDTTQLLTSIFIPSIDLREDFREAAVTDDGQAILLFESNNNRYDEEFHKFTILKASHNDDISTFILESQNILNTGVVLGIDNKNELLSIAGLGGKEEDELTGYFLYTKNFNHLPEIDTVTLVPFDVDLPRDLHGNNKKDKVSNYEMTEMMFRADGGCILFAEMKKSYVRRTSYPGRFDGEAYSQRGFIDHYNEDILMFNVAKDGTLDWRKVLFKKQFSQDDDGAFSSFFIFKTPSRIRIIYNDEIKNSNTVSEYVIDPMGNLERNTILNTDYQNIKLRFLNGIQISGNELLVPSEKSYKISLVKITY